VFEMPINLIRLREASENWLENKPFPHLVVDGFFGDELASLLESEFPSFESDVWYGYSNAIEVKKVCNNWNVFPPATYKVFEYLNSQSFVTKLSSLLLESKPLYSDYGLNGGGWHIHSTGGKLNTHLDYSLHPKLGLQRKLNIIVYLNSHWKPEWGGELGLWGAESPDSPGELVKEIDPLFNRAVIFDTTQNSWHGLPKPITAPAGECRKSIAIYYLCDPPKHIDQRGKALFAPTDEQKDDPQVLELIKKRSNVATASSVYSQK
jgi:hypothetical protein